MSSQSHAALWVRLFSWLALSLHVQSTSRMYAFFISHNHFRCFYLLIFSVTRMACAYMCTHDKHARVLNYSFARAKKKKKKKKKAGVGGGGGGGVTVILLLRSAQQQYEDEDVQCLFSHSKTLLTILVLTVDGSTRLEVRNNKRVTARGS